MGSPTGPLSLPERGPVYLDATSLIYGVERIEPYYSAIEPVWQQARMGWYELVTSELSILETLVRPIREGNRTLVDLFQAALLGADEVKVIAATPQTWQEAARIRAHSRLGTPDALHAATAMLANCTLFLTNDSDFRRVPGLPAVILGDVVR